MIICKKCGGEIFKVLESKKDFKNNVRIRKKLCLECRAIYVTSEKMEYEVKNVSEKPI